MLSVVGDVPVDSGVPVVTSSISRICRLSLSEVLIGVGLRACIHRDECARVFVSVSTVFLKKKRRDFRIKRSFHSLGVLQTRSMKFATIVVSY